MSRKSQVFILRYSPETRVCESDIDFLFSSEMFIKTSELNHPSEKIHENIVENYKILHFLHHVAM